MKKFITTICAASSLLFSLTAEEVCETKPTEEPLLLIDFVDIRDAKTDVLLNIMDGRTENLALHFPKGVSIPLKAALTGNLIEFSSHESDLSVMVKKDFFMRSSKGDFLFSTDLQDWSGMKEFITGNLCASLVKDKADPIYAMIHAEANERK